MRVRLESKSSLERVISVRDWSGTGVRGACRNPPAPSAHGCALCMAHMGVRLTYTLAGARVAGMAWRTSTCYPSRTALLRAERVTMCASAPARHAVRLVHERRQYLTKQMRDRSPSQLSVPTVHWGGSDDKVGMEKAGAGVSPPASLAACGDTKNSYTIALRMKLYFTVLSFSVAL